MKKSENNCNIYINILLYILLHTYLVIIGCQKPELDMGYSITNFFQLVSWFLDSNPRFSVFFDTPNSKGLFCKLNELSFS